MWGGRGGGQAWKGGSRREDRTCRGLHAAGAGGSACEPGVGRDGAGEVREASPRGPVVLVNCGDFCPQSRGSHGRCLRGGLARSPELWTGRWKGVQDTRWLCHVRRGRVMLWARWGPWGLGTEVGERQQGGGGCREARLSGWGGGREGGAELAGPREGAVSGAREAQPQARAGGGAQPGPREDGAAGPSAALRPSTGGPAALGTAQTRFSQLVRPSPAPQAALCARSGQLWVQ